MVRGSVQALPATIAVLVVTCPCALSLATPAVLAAATADLARRGVLVAHSDAFEALAKATHVLWDKTGTLTRGLVRVEDVRLLRDGRRGRMPGAGGRARTHVGAPDRKAFVARAWPTRTATDVTVTPGAGLEGTVEAGGCASARWSSHAAWRRAAPAPVEADGSGSTSVTGRACSPASG